MEEHKHEEDVENRQEHHENQEHEKHESHAHHEHKQESEDKEEDKQEVKSDDEKKIGIMPIVVTVGLIIIFLGVVFVSVNYYHPEAPEGKNYYLYNNFDFTNITGDWITEVQLREGVVHQLKMRYHPYDVEDIPVYDDFKQDILDADRIYLTVEPNLTSITVLSMLEIGRVLGTKHTMFNKEVHSALTRMPNPDYNTTEIVDCSNSTPKNLVIWFKTGNETKVYKENDCIMVQGTDEWETFKASDRAIYDILGIIN